MKREKGTPLDDFRRVDCSAVRYYPIPALILKNRVRGYLCSAKRAAIQASPIAATIAVQHLHTLSIV
jgi:hypothetical protein